VPWRRPGPVACLTITRQALRRKGRLTSNAVAATGGHTRAT
jgi:hypothetical protein